MRQKKGRYNREAGEMRTELSQGDPAAGGLEVTYQLVRRAETKLFGLHANRSQLRKRIRALHYLLKTLDTVFSISNSSGPDLYPAARKAGGNHDELPGSEKSSEAAVTSRTGANDIAGKSSMAAVSTLLRRACRIALMESDRPQGCEQIVQRIRRRESVCIEHFDDPKTMIAQELRKMLADGEVVQKKAGRLWQLNRDSISCLAQDNSNGN